MPCRRTPSAACATCSAAGAISKPSTAPRCGRGDPTPHDLAAFWWRDPDEARRLCALLQATTDAAIYVAAWCRLNHLTGGKA